MVGAAMTISPKRVLSWVLIKRHVKKKQKQAIAYVRICM